MARIKQDIAAEVAKRLAAEIPHDAKTVAERLWAAVPPGMDKLSRPEYLDLLRRQWQNGKFREDLLRRVGPKNFIATAKEVLRPPDEIILGEGLELEDEPEVEEEEYIGW